MRTALWSLAALAGSVIAAPGKVPAYYGNNGTDTTCTEERKSTVPTAPVYPATYGSSSSKAVSSSASKSAKWSYSFSANSSSYGPTATGGHGAPGYGAPGYGGPSSTVTVITTTYETHCPGVSTYITGGTTELSSYTTTSTVTETLTLTVPVAPGYSQSSPNGPEVYPSQSEVSSHGWPNGPGAYPSSSEGAAPTTVKTYTTVYSTVYPGTTTGVSGGKTITRTYETTKTVTSTWYETITLTAMPTGYASESAPVYATQTAPGYVHESSPASGSESAPGYASHSAPGYGSESAPVTATPTGYSPAESSSSAGGHTPSVYVTTITKTQTIIVEKTTTAVVGGSTVTSLYSGTSLHTSVYTSTCTEGASTIWTTVQFGSTYYSYTVPLTSSSSSASSPYGPIETTSSSEAPWYPIPSYSNSSPYGYGSGTGSKPVPTGPVSSSKSSSKSSPSGSASLSTASGSKLASSSSKAVSSPAGSSPVSSPSGSASKPVSSLSSSKIISTPVSSLSKPISSASGSTPVSSPSKPASTPISSPSKAASTPVSSASKPASTPISRAGKPVSSLTTSSKSMVSSFTSTKTSSTSTSSTSTCSKPTPTLSGSCVPCEGQPKSNPDEYCGYTISDNWYDVMPKTCRTVEYNFEISNGTVSPDGVDRIGFLINGQFPGPKIEANWGDTIVVHVTNSLTTNGTSLHFHGIRQLNTNEMDGVPSITQCALAPGDSMTYTFKASNYGSSWYHSHFAIQTYGGVFGPMVIHGPATAEYDFEESIIVQDWNHATTDSLYDAAQTQGPRTLDTGLINGLNVWGGADDAAGTTGKRFSMTVIPNKRYRLRLVNTAIQSTFKFYIDGHKFKVIAMDFVPIVPYETEIVNINIGQRYDLIFTADQTPGNYWMRSDNQNICAQITQATNIKGIVTYQGVTPATPSSTAYTYTQECVDEPLASLVPYVPLNAGIVADETVDETVTVGKNSVNLFKWSLSGTTFQSQWGDPTLNQIYHNGTIPTYSGRLAIEVPKLKEWVYIIIDSPIPTPHPIHLHGHDFFILAQGTGLYNSAVVLNTVNPPRRDVALMPFSLPPNGLSGGHLVLAFETDNPGAWLMHCHIGWHVSMGFALQIIEGTDLIKDTVTDSCQLDNTCSAWNSYAKTNGIVVADSGV